MGTKLEQLALEEYAGQAPYLDYARSLDRLLAEHDVDVDARFLDVVVREPGGRASTQRTFVMEAGEGTPMVFFNGTPATSAVWVPLLPRLSGVRAILVDRPGHGLSGELDYAAVPDIRAHAVPFTESLLDALGHDTVVLAGNSFGGLWCLWFAAQRPERVSSVVLPGVPPGLLHDRTPLIFGLLSVGWVSRLMRKLDPPRLAASRRMFAMMGDPPDQLSENFIESYTRGQQLPNVVGGTAHLIQHARFPGRMPQELVLGHDELSRIPHPTLVLVGPKDFVADPTEIARLVQPIPDHRVEVVGIGHLPWLQDRDSVAAAICKFIDHLASNPET
jgi:2-hydroxy-6-oxonona-2,4-dienedioate hydrolase